MVLTEQGRSITLRFPEQEDHVSAQSTSRSSKSACYWSHGVRCRVILRLHLHGHSPRCKYPSIAVVIRHVHALWMSCPSDSLSSEWLQTRMQILQLRAETASQASMDGLPGTSSAQGAAGAPACSQGMLSAMQDVTLQAEATLLTNCMPTLQRELHAPASY